MFNAPCSTIGTESLCSNVQCSTIGTESLCSNTESFESPKDSDITYGDFTVEAFASELLENGFKEERFRIDRKKLEDMLQGQPVNDAENAEDFFQRVMIETSTQISWPSKLKIGAKSKKDPHVKIVGKPDDVQEAKDRILEILDTKKNRVTLKMDVSHTDHSYIIGKGGFKIQQVMEETGCHIHFPDSNRNGTAEKSNQVSIAGQATGVEMARYKIRELLPLVFTFELPNGKTVNPGTETSPDIQHIQQTYSFNVAFKAIGPLGMGRTLLVVRGCQRLLSRLRQGLALLMEYLTGSKTIPIMGFMKTEIAAQHHQFVIGPGSANIQMIMNKTGATITFPDSTTIFSDPAQGVVTGHSISRSKSTVFIQGSFDSVCLAWQELLKCLPLVMMFDLREGQELDPVMINRFMETFSINIMVRPKTKENTKSVLVRGAEKDSKILFQVRKDILGLDDEDFICRPLPTARQDSAMSTPVQNGVYNHESIGHLQLHQPSVEVKSSPAAARPNMSTAESINLLTNIIRQNPQIIGLLNSLSTAMPPVSNIPVVVHPPPASNIVYRHSDSSYPPSVAVSTKEHVENWIKRQEQNYAYSGSGTATPHNRRNLHVDDGDSGIFLPSHNRYTRNGFESRSDLSSQPESSASSTSSTEASDYKTRFFEKLAQAKESNHQVNAEVHQLLTDYENKKLVANKAMQQPVGDGVRTPTQQWSGYGFSKSVPDFVMRAKLASQSSGSTSEYNELENRKPQSLNMTAAKTWSPEIAGTSEKKSDSPLEQVPSPFSLSNFWENIPQQPSVNYNSIRTLDQLFSVLGLDKYSDVFLHHEIDFPTFLTLTDMDLQQLNISYGARRRMLSAIAALREQRSGDWSLKSFHAAPGAERRCVFPRYSATNSITDDSSIDGM